MTPLLTIIVSLLGCFCFYQWEKNRKDAEEVKLLMERTERLEAEKKQKADTTWFYLPIFEKYGYGIDDYRKSVDYYLNDPKRYAEMMDRVVKDMKGEAERIHRAVDRQEKARQKADSIANALKVYSPGRVLYYEDLFMVNSMTDRIDIHKNPRGVYVPEPVVEDTLFHGPELIIRDTLEVPVAKEPPLPIPCLE